MLLCYYEISIDFTNSTAIVYFVINLPILNQIMDLTEVNTYDKICLSYENNLTKYFADNL